MEAGFEGTVFLATEAIGLRGTSILTVNIARELARRGVKLALVTATEEFFREATDGKVELLAHKGLTSWALRAPAGKLIARAAKERKAAVLHVLGAGRARFWAGVARAAGCPLILTATSFVRGQIWTKKLRESGARVLALSEAIRADLVTKGKVPKEMVKILRSGVDCTAAAPSQCNEQEAEHMPVIATMGPLEESKGLTTFLQATQKLARRKIDFQALLIGSGPLEGELRTLRAKLDIMDRVVFAPGNAGYGEMLAGIDVFVLPSEEQALGQTMLEAMGRGKPVVASGVGGIYSVVTDREQGLIVKSEDADDLAEAIAKLLADGELRKSMGRAARKRVCEEFRIEDTADALLAVYRESAGKARRTAG
ncbi:MAG: glycosyltransferase family 4 protein [Planctomycetota bacterium]